MRIVFDHQLMSLQDMGGGSRYFYELIRYFAGAPDVRVKLVLGFYRSAYPFHALPLQAGGVLGWRVPLSPGMLRYALNEAVGTAACVVSGVHDVYHSTYFRFMPAVRARVFVATHHDCVYEHFPHLFPDASRVIRYKTALYARADLILCISESSQRCLIDYYGLKAAKTRVVYHGLNQLPRPAHEVGRDTSRRPYFLFVGARGHHKNFHALLQAFHVSGLHRDFELHALGGGPATPEERQLLQSLGLQSRVKIVPSATDAMLAESYSAANLFVYPSLAEGFGMPPLEAMSLDCPVAASNTSAIPEICRDAPFYFDPCDIDSIASTLRTAASDGPSLRRAIARGREVAALYSWETCGANTLAAYRAAL